MRYNKKILLAICTVIGIGTTLCLFLVSEDIMTTANPFVRRFPPHPVEYLSQTELAVDSYYIAGYGNGNIYLGSYTTNRYILEIDSTFKRRRSYSIKLNDSTKLKSARLVVKGSSFYLADGTSPIIATGSTSDWKAHTVLQTQPYFSLAVQTDSSSFAFRGISSANGQNILGLVKTGTNPSTKVYPGLLQKQPGGDGVFDTDGYLVYDTSLSRVVYVYAYRNQFIVADKNLNLVYTGKTIDTVSVAKIKAVKKANGVSMMAAPPLTVNGGAATVGHLLFVDAKLRGKFEKLDVWKRATTFDIYNLKDGKYLMSFYIPMIGRHKLHSFYLTETRFYAVIGNTLVEYEIRKDLLKEIRKKPDAAVRAILRYTGRYQEHDRKPVIE